MNFVPTPKIATSAIAGSIVTVIVWIVGLFHVSIPPEVAAALTVIISFFAGYFAPRSQPPSTPPN